MADDLLQEQTPPASIVAELPPQGQAAGAWAGQPLTASRISPQREYAVVANALPHRVLDLMDSLIRDRGCFIGPAEFERMAVSDAEVGKVVNVLVGMALADGIAVLPNVKPPLRQPLLMETPGEGAGELARETPEMVQARADYEAEVLRYNSSRRVRDLCQASLDALDRPLVDTAEDMVRTGIVVGNSIAEQTFQIPAAGKWAGRLLHKRLAVKERGAVQFVTDKFRNVLGFVARGVPNTASAIAANLLPAEKFVVFNPRVHAEDPRGISFLTQARTSYEIKAHLWPELLRYALQVAFNSIVAVAPDPKIHSGVPATDFTVDPATGQRVPVPMTVQIGRALEGLDSHSIAVLPHGSTVNFASVVAEGGKAFELIIKLLNGEIEQAVVWQTLALSEGKHMDRASSDTAMGVLDVAVYALKTKIANMVRNLMLKPVVLYNLGEEALEFLPDVSCGDTERRNFKDDMDALTAAGYAMHPSQFQAADQMVGLPVRSDYAVIEELAARRAEMDAKRAQMAARQSQPGATGGAGDRQQQGGDPSKPAASSGRVAVKPHERNMPTAKAA